VNCVGFEQELRTSADVEKAVDARIEEMVARVAEEAPRVGYKPGSGFTFATADKNFSLNVGGRLQARFTYDGFENETNGVAGGSSADPEADRLDFSVPRTRLRR
jgi:phage-related protein